MEGAAPSRRGGMKSIRLRSFSQLLGGHPGMSEGARAILGEGQDEEGEEPVEEEDSGEIEVADALTNAPEIREQMTQFMGQLTQAVNPRDNSKAPAFKTPSIKAPNPFHGTQAHKLRIYPILSINLP
ncbi:hypothetical protein O181_092095 [Austropuccinia psidii MF-1]|uniref:Uncharacterized protein n=1 Tax=Austropuccinia psidii MF-1 TaxID=1389203 RepID=A0A9Q3P8R8_9BASI|nr:hypothetical protein [Austropuccinia psidii MF-1]